MSITIKIFKNNELVSTQHFDKGSVRIGNSDFCDLVLQDEKISRRAIEIRIAETNVYFTNMGPSGKLLVDGRKQETGELKNGSMIQVGSFKLAFIIGQEVSRHSEQPESLPVSENKENEAPVDLGMENNNPANNDIFGDQLLGNINGDVDQNSPPEVSPSPELLDEQAVAIAENIVEFPELKQENEAAVRTQLSSGNLAVKERTETFEKALVAKVLIIEGPRKGEEVPVQSFELSFGRSSKADVVINDHKLSRIHAKIIRFGNGYRIIDLNSHNGTRVNGVRILEHPLSSYDVIEFGSTKLKFLIHDIVINEGAQTTNLVPVSGAGKETTKSLHIDEVYNQGDLAIESAGAAPPNSIGNPRDDGFVDPGSTSQKKSPLKILIVVVLAVAISFWIITSNSEKGADKKTDSKADVTRDSTDKAGVLPKIPKDFSELSEEMQRRIEGYYNSAFAISQRTDLSKEEIEKAKEDLARIHQSLPYYKNSREMVDQFDKRYRDKLSQIASEKAKQEADEDLNIYLEDGLEYLKQGEFDRAIESFTLAMNLSPRNPIAMKGLRAAQAKVRDLESVPVEVDPEEEKVKQVKEIYSKAVEALNNRAYQEAIELAESIRKINIKNDQTYLNEAKQIIDRAKIAQKEEFEPFLIQAKEKFSEGDYNAARDLCEEMLKRDPAYDEAKELLAKSKKQLNRLAKEAYTHGYILESIGQIEQAKQYWNRAKNYVRTGDDYFDKVNKKLEQYQ